MPTEPVPSKIRNAKFAGIKDLTSSTKEISIKLDEPFDFSAGQYVWIELPTMTLPDPRGNRRAFSITSVPNQNTIQTILKASESGYKKTLLSLNPGDPIRVHGPFGSFMKTGIEGDGDLIFLAGGMAVAPFMSVIRDFSGKNLPRKIYLVHDCKNPDEAVYLDELKDLENKNPNFKYIQIFGPLDQNHIRDANKEHSSANWYVTGPQGFVDAAWTFIKGEGISTDKVAFEEHYPASEEFSTLELKDLDVDSQSFFKLALDKAFLHIIITDINGYVLYANEAAERITGYSMEEMRGNTPRLWGGLMSAEFYKELWFTKKSIRQPFTGKITNRKKNGEIYVARTTISPIIDKNGKALGFVGTEEDITKLEQTTTDLERFNKVTVDRELKMVELKRQIEDLTNKLKANG